jgi:hypothetical protein
MTPAEQQINQCDGCNQQLLLRNGIHYDESDHPFMACTSDRYAAPDAATPDIWEFEGDWYISGGWCVNTKEFALKHLEIVAERNAAQARVAELEVAVKTLGRQLELRASGHDPLTVLLRSKFEQSESALNALQALIDGAKGELPLLDELADSAPWGGDIISYQKYVHATASKALESAARAIAKERQRAEAAEHDITRLHDSLTAEVNARLEAERQIAAEREKVRRMETALERECKDGDAISYAVGVARTEGGSLQVQKILNAISKHQGRAWLIERNAKHGVTPARWFEERRCFARGDQDLWVYDAHRAVRFDTKEQAEREIQRLFGHEWDKELYPVFPEATEHVFIDAARKEKP